MAKEEIVAGLRNAVERGQSIQQAIQSMTNAGYDPKEIQEASGYVNMGATGVMQQKPQIYVNPPESSPQDPNQEITKVPLATKSVMNTKTKVILLISVLVLILTGIGTAIYFMLKP